MANNNELCKDANYINNFTVPDKILAEDKYSAEIYKKAGYINIVKMEKGNIFIANGFLTSAY